jgi:hypothetical protein
MNSNIKFIKDDDEMIYKPIKRIDTYYQLCQYKNPFTREYGTRKIIFNEQGAILKIYEKEYSKKKVEEFVKHHKINKYKIYPVCDIKTVDLPSGNDMTETISSLLNNNCTEYGYASINQ